jgi:ribonuclease P protein component
LVVYLSSGSPGTLKVGVVVNKKVGKAVDRNRVKRRLKALAAARVPELTEGTALVVRALPPAREMGFRELQEDFDGALGDVMAARAVRRGR